MSLELAIQANTAAIQQLIATIMSGKMMHPSVQEMKDHMGESVAEEEPLHEDGLPAAVPECLNSFPEPEAIVVSQQAGARIVELPVVMRAREAGYSSIRYLKTLYYMVKVTLAILLHMIR